MQIWYILLILFFHNQTWAFDCQSIKPLRTFVPSKTKAFFIEYYDGYKVLHRDDDQVILYNKETQLPCQSVLYKIKTPVEKIIMSSTTQLPALELLSLENSLIGFQGKKYIFSNKFKTTNIVDVSFPLIPEQLLKINSDLVMSYQLNTSSVKLINEMRKLNIPLVLNNDYLEKNALARAEWLIYVASFYNKEDEAQKLFQNIVDKYEDIKKKVVNITPRKKILVGDIQNGKWITCGGKSDLAQIITDAGGELLLHNEEFSTQSMSLEALYLLQNKPDVWLTQNNWKNRTGINKDSRYKKINIKNIFNNHKRISLNGANDYWEMGMTRPDLMLEDLAAVFYPKYFLKHNLFWYKQL
jgi:iron complex transport system substrate-binding protein